MRCCICCLCVERPTVCHYYLGICMGGLYCSASKFSKPPQPLTMLSCICLLGNRLGRHYPGDIDLLLTIFSFLFFGRHFCVVMPSLMCAYDPSFWALFWDIFDVLPNSFCTAISSSFTLFCPFFFTLLTCLFVCPLFLLFCSHVSWSIFILFWVCCSGTTFSYYSLVLHIYTFLLHPQVWLTDSSSSCLPCDNMPSVPMTCHTLLHALLLLLHTILFLSISYACVLCSSSSFQHFLLYAPSSYTYTSLTLPSHLPAILTTVAFTL